jgi:hypothetical protein
MNGIQILDHFLIGLGEEFVESSTTLKNMSPNLG